MQNFAIKPNNIQRVQTRSSTKSFSILKLLGVGIVLLFLLGVLFVFIYRARYLSAVSSPNSTETTQVTFVVDPGDSPEAIADGLIQLGLLSEEKRGFFLIYLRLSKLDSKLQAGQFKLSMNLTIKELAQSLQNSGLPSVWITIPEGRRYDEIAEMISTELINQEDAQFDKASFLEMFEDQTLITELGLAPSTNLEGFLFPDKYLLPVDSSTKDVIVAMVENYKERTSMQYTYEELIIASLIEREAKNEEQRYIISDIIHKRINEGWLLGIDAANLYYHGDWKYPLTYQDLEEQHPFNTRIYTGLPPTPICSPGLSSLKAAADPVETDYYYYIHDSGNIMYPAKTLAEHNQNISKYLR